MSSLDRWSAIVGVEISPLSPRQREEAYRGRFVLPDGAEASVAEVVQLSTFAFRKAELWTRRMPTPRGVQVRVSRLQASFQQETYDFREPLVLLRLKGEDDVWSYFGFDLPIEVSSWGSP